VVVAEQLRSASIDTRHLLVALVERGGAVADGLRSSGVDPDDVVTRARASIAATDTLDAEALASLGIDLDAVRERTDEVFGPGALERAARRDKRRRSRYPFTPDARKALELSLREAVRLKTKTIGSRHLMLGILRADSPGGRVVDQAGADLVALRTALEQQPPQALGA
jgi:ATP-dependent Clp protease ATP-binding subunit ClpA